VETPQLAKGVNMTEWISNLDDRVPENEQIVLAYDKNRGLVLAEFRSGTEDYESYDIDYEIWYEVIEGELKYLIDVVYWSPIDIPDYVIEAAKS